MAQTTYYVDASRPDNSGSGTNWSAAKKDLQFAINIAVAGDQIWVKAGTYLPTHDPFSNTAPVNNRDKTFSLKNGVKIYGGFTGSETQLNQRDWKTNVTILSGDLGVVNSLTDNAYHVVLSVNLTNTTILDGFTITKGYATAPGGSTVTVNTRVIERYHGGGVFNSHSATSFTNCTISFNSADCTNTDNDAVGAGIINNLCSSTFTNCLIDSNSFLMGGASFGVFAAGMAINGGSCVINSCVFSNNTSGSGFFDASRGGAMTLDGTASIINTVFYNNSSQNGAGIQFGGGSNNLSTITNCTFANNTSSFAGTAYQGFSKATFKNCIFWNNTPTASGVTGRNEIYSQESNPANQPTFLNCIIKDASGSPFAVTNAILNNCLNNNPLFSNISDGNGLDNIWGTADDGLVLQSTSPGKNFGLFGTGIPLVDIIGNTRDSQPDLGAYEYQNPCVNPSVFAISGGGSYCAGGSGLVISLTDSEIGVTYQLKNGGTNAGTPINGTGNTISLGNQTVAGTYTIEATRTVGGCSSTMSGNAFITITPNLTPTFNAINPICSGAILTALPTTSNNGITGTWAPALNNTTTTTYTFTPTTGQCATTTTLTITVNPNITPTFTPVNPICAGTTLSALPTTSNNNITGTWAPALNNTATTTYTFTPTTGQCATTTTLTITVNPNITPTFTPVNPICAGETLTALPTTSNNDITGTWAPALNNTATTTYTFTPTTGQCATTTTLTITVNPNITPTFIAINPICSGETLTALPTTSNNGITGTWFPALNNTATTTYTFTPTIGQCATTTTLTITVNPNITPTFIAINPICSGETLTALPTTSNNGITGTWSPVLNNTATTTYTFTPTTGLCATNTILTVVVNTTPTPTGNSMQNFNVYNPNEATLANLIVNPTNVIWYGSLADANSGINPLPIETVLVNGLSYFAVASSDGCPSLPFEVIVNVTLGTNSFDNESIVIYPIPTSGLVNLNSKLNIETVSVINNLGQTISSKKINSNNDTIDLSSFASGSYYLKIESELGVKIIRIVKD